MPSRLAELVPRVDTLRRAIVQLSTSSRWKSLLGMILAVGNFVNYHSKARCNAAGIKLESLCTIADTKSVDNKTNLLHFICDTLEQTSPDVLAVSKVELLAFGW